MQQKSKPLDYATKKDLEVLGNKLRGEIKSSAEEVTTRLRSEIKSSADEVTRRLEETMLGVKDTLLNAVDGYTKELEENRQDRTLAAHQTASLRENVNNHEKRIKHLEKTQQAA